MVSDCERVYKSVCSGFECLSGERIWVDPSEMTMMS
jgi:hypothetical protein